MPMFEEAICMIPSAVKLWLGASVIVNLRTAEGHEAREFQAEYNGQIAAVVGFESVYVGPLHHGGLLPGVYPGEQVCIRLGNGNRQWVRPHMLVLNEMVTTKATSQLSRVEPKPLPRKIRYYPDDVVRRQSDPLKERRKVVRVEVKENGEVFYCLSQTAAAKMEYEERLAEYKKRGRIGLGLANLGLSSQTERSDGAGLKLVARGNVYHLYEAPKKLRFTSDVEELAFWARDGVSERVSTGSGPYLASKNPLRGEFTLKEARKLVERGEGDLIVKPAPSGVIWVENGADRGGHHVYKLHDCFSEHRERVRALTARLKEVPSIGAEVEDSSDLAKRVVGIN